jgi:hypothetical protein
MEKSIQEAAETVVKELEFLVSCNVRADILQRLIWMFEAQMEAHACEERSPKSDF